MLKNGNYLNATLQKIQILTIFEETYEREA